MKLETKDNVNYSATVFRIRNLVKLEGLDNLVAVPVLGHQALVSKDHEVDQLVVAFTAETQLSEAFAQKNNLHRDATLNDDSEVTGYLEANRRIRAIKLRGHRSDALIMPLSSLAFTGAKPEDFKDGDTFDHVNGVEICRKFIVPVKENPRAKKDATEKINKFEIVDAIFAPEHISTSSFFRTDGGIRPDDEIIVTQKAHGCFLFKTKVTMWDGTQKSISKILPGDEVLGFDHETGRMVRSKVLKTAVTGKTDEWVRTELRMPLKGDNPVLYSTPDHKFYTRTRGYVEAQSLLPDDVLVFERHMPEITDEKLAIIEGMILGDGSFAKTGAGGQYGISWGVKSDHEESIRHRMALLGNIVTGTIRRRTSGYGTNMLDAATIRHPLISELASKWGHVDGKKTVPEDFEFNDMSLAVFYMDDGSLAHSDVQRDRAVFAACDWDDESAERIAEAMVRWGVESPKVYRDSEGYNRIRLNTADAYTMFDRIAKLIPSALAYKLPEEMRHLATAELDGGPQDSTIAYTVDAKVVGQSVVSAKKAGGNSKYDIETETHNFFAGHTLVHNSSVRIFNTIRNRQLSLLERIAKKLGVKVETTEYGPIFGSRRVIKNDPNAGTGYFSDDIWSETGQKVVDTLPAGYGVYGEIVGWTPSGKPVQPKYTYGLPERTSDLYVYRVTTINSQGVELDLGWDQLVEFCAARGLKTVPVVWRGKSKDFDVNDWMDKRYRDSGFLNCLPLSDPKTVDEGVVVRKDGITPVLLKAKSPAFLQFETKQLDKGEVDMESVEG